MKKLYLILMAAMLMSFNFSCAQPPENGTAANQGNYDNNVLFIKMDEPPEEDEILPFVCIHDNDSSFHNCEIIYAYLEQSGRIDEFYKWREETVEKTYAKNDPECTYVLFNIYDCLHYFDVPRDFFEDYYTDYIHTYADFPIDLLYNGTREEVFEYYYDLEARYITFNQKGSHFLLKRHMVRVMDMEDNDEIFLAVQNFSIPEFIYETGMTKEQFYLAKERVIQLQYQPVMHAFYDHDIEELFYDYNIDDVYENCEFYEALIGVIKPYYIDEIIQN